MPNTTGGSKNSADRASHFDKVNTASLKLLGRRRSR